MTVSIRLYFVFPHLPTPACQTVKESPSLTRQWRHGEGSPLDRGSRGDGQVATGKSKTLPDGRVAGRHILILAVPAVAVFQESSWVNSPSDRVSVCGNVMPVGEGPSTETSRHGVAGFRPADQCPDDVLHVAGLDRPKQRRPQLRRLPRKRGTAAKVIAPKESPALRVAALNWSVTTRGRRREGGLQDAGNARFAPVEAVFSNSSMLSLTVSPP